MRRILLVGFLSLIACVVVAAEQISKTSDQATEEKNRSLEQIIMEEYKAVRTEIIQCLDQQVSIISLGFAAVGALLGGGVASLNRRRPYLLVAALVFGVGVSLASLYVIDIWSVETRRLARASYHACYLEKKINAFFPSDIKALEWENRVRNDETYRSILPSAKQTPAIFVLVALFSIVGGGILFSIAVTRQDYPRFSKFRIPVLLAVSIPLLCLVYLRWEELQYLKTIWRKYAC